MAITFNGAAGEVWTNETGRSQYQLIVKWQNSCGLCAQFDHAIGPSWPIPFHRNCRCHQLRVPAGGTAQPFVDFKEKIAELDPKQQARVIGRSNWTLVSKGIVEWADVVTGQRIRDFREVVALQKLSIKDLVKAGVSDLQARKAYEAVHTPAHELAAKRRQELVSGILDKGMEREILKRALGERLAARVGIGAGPSGPGRMPPPRGGPGPIHPFPPRLILPPLPPLPLTTPPEPEADAEYLRRLGVKADAIPAPAPPPAGTPILPGRPIEERVAAWAEGDEKLAALRKLETDMARVEADIERRRESLWKTTKQLKDEDWSAGTPEAKARIDRMFRRDELFHKTIAKLRIMKETAAERVLSILAVPDAERVKFEHGDTIKALRSKRGPEWKALAARAEATRLKLESITRAPGKTIASEWDTIPPKKEQRAYALNKTTAAGARVNSVHLAKTETTAVIAHELTHTLEWQILRIHERAREFLAYRCGNEVPVSLKQLYPDSKYGPEEFGRKDKFDQYFSERSAWYVGKVYNFDGSEVITMGVQALFENAPKFARLDPEYCKFILGILDGSLR